MCVKLGLKEDVAGATFMAFGSSAAVMLISFTTIAHGGDYIDLGIGCIVGFALLSRFTHSAGFFCTLIIPAICAMISAKPIEIRRDIFLRDLIFYLLCLAGLIIFIADKVLFGIEGLYLLVVYIGYLVYIVFVPKVQRTFRSRQAVDLAPFRHA